MYFIYLKLNYIFVNFFKTLHSNLVLGINVIFKIIEKLSQNISFSCIFNSNILYSIVFHTNCSNKISIDTLKCKPYKF